MLLSSLILEKTIVPHPAFLQLIIDVCMKHLIYVHTDYCPTFSHYGIHQ